MRDGGLGFILQTVNRFTFFFFLILTYTQTEQSPRCKTGTSSLAGTPTVNAASYISWKLTGTEPRSLSEHLDSLINGFISSDTFIIHKPPIVITFILSGANY